MENIILYYIWLYKGDWEKISGAIEMQHHIDSEKIEELKQKWAGEMVSVFSPDYPSKLRRKCLNRPPFGLFFKGNFALLNKLAKTVSLTASVVDVETEENISKILEECNSNDVTVVTGARTEFEKSLLRNKNLKNAIIVLDHSIELELEDLEHISDSNLVISECPTGMGVLPTETIQERVRSMITSLSSNLIVVNSLKETELFRMIWVAIDNGAQVLCQLDGPDILENHNSKLITCGASVYNSISDLNFSRI